MENTTIKFGNKAVAIVNNNLFFVGNHITKLGRIKLAEHLGIKYGFRVIKLNN